MSGRHDLGMTLLQSERRKDEQGELNFADGDRTAETTNSDVVPSSTRSTQLSRYKVKSASLRGGLGVRFWRAVCAEFVAVVWFVFGGVTAVIANKGSLLPVAIAHGLLIFVLVAVVGRTSGGHINPAVSFGVCLAGHISIVRMLCYWIGQLLGAVVGAALALGMSDNMFIYDYGAHLLSNSITETVGNVTATTIHGTKMSQAVVIEALMTSLLVTVVLLTAVDSAGPHFIAPLCIGTAVTVGILVSGPLTGGSMNPARSFGPAVISLDSQWRHRDAFDIGPSYYNKFWQDHWVYWAGPLLGGAVASLLYRFLLSSSVGDLTPIHLREQSGKINIT